MKTKQTSLEVPLTDEERTQRDAVLKRLAKAVENRIVDIYLAEGRIPMVVIDGKEIDPNEQKEQEDTEDAGTA